jgi:hypothetical protein
LGDGVKGLLRRGHGETPKVIGRFPGESSCLRLCWAVLDLVIASGCGLGLTDLDHRRVTELRAAHEVRDTPALIA